MLDEFFEKTVVISLPRNASRRERLRKNVEESGIGGNFCWFDAIDGRERPAPPGWHSGKGGWGCLLSHLAVLRQAVDEGVRSLLILEDDVCFSAHTPRWLPVFMKALPGGWHQIYLGGQHLLAPQPTDHPMVWVPGNINRTHAYAVSHAGAVRLLRYLSDLELYTYDPGWHVDHALGHGHFMQRWQTYCPPWWFCGQDECVSDVSAGARLSRRWWPYWRYSRGLPFVIAEPGEPDLDCYLMFDSDVELPEEHRNTFPGERADDALLIPWMRSQAAFALAHGRLPAVPASSVFASRLGKLWPAGVRYTGVADLPGLCDYPYNRLFSHPMNNTE
jgi:hypothetical protein